MAWEWVRRSPPPAVEEGQNRPAVRGAERRELQEQAHKLGDRHPNAAPDNEPQRSLE